MKFKNRKAQSAIEFMIMISVVMIMFATLYAVFSGKRARAFRRETRLQAGAIADRISYEFDLALVQGNGFSKNFQLPLEIGTQDYNVTLLEGDRGTFIFVEWGENSVNSYSAAPKIIGNLENGANRIENEEGVLHVSQS